MYRHTKSLYHLYVEALTSVGGKNSGSQLLERCTKMPSLLVTQLPAPPTPTTAPATAHRRR